jgi:uncharacterized protein
MTHLRRIFVIYLGLFALLAAPAAAVNFPPRPQGPIYDEADLLPAAEEAQLDQRLHDFDARTGDAVIVATVKSLQGDSVEDYAVKLYDDWGIGGKERDTGVLLLVAPNEHKVWIETGYGLTPYITDILSGRIVRDDMIPRFKQNDYPGGIEAGVDAILKQLSLSPTDAKAVAEAAAAAEKNRPHGGGSIPAGGIVWLLFLLFFFVLPAFRRRKGQRYGGGVGSAVGNVLLWSALSGLGGGRNSGGGWGGSGGFGGGGGFGGFGGGMASGGGAGGSW